MNIQNFEYESEVTFELFVFDLKVKYSNLLLRMHISSNNNAIAIGQLRCRAKPRLGKTGNWATPRKSETLLAVADGCAVP